MGQTCSVRHSTSASAYELVCRAERLAEASDANGVNGATQIAALPTTKREPHLSDYYVETEGILLAEFGDFLGKFADRIDGAVVHSDA
jgi:hypothetical protein